MRNNIILHKIIQTLKLTDDEVIKILKQENQNITNELLQSIINQEVPCSYEVLGSFLDAIITLKRGTSTTIKADEVIELTNNVILKKVRIALELKEEETLKAFKNGGEAITKQKLSYMLRKAGHTKFKKCSYELLISFLDGLKETK